MHSCGLLLTREATIICIRNDMGPTILTCTYLYPDRYSLHSLCNCNRQGCDYLYSDELMKNLHRNCINHNERILKKISNFGECLAFWWRLVCFQNDTSNNFSRPDFFEMKQENRGRKYIQTTNDAITITTLQLLYTALLDFRNHKPFALVVNII